MLFLAGILSILFTGCNSTPDQFGQLNLKKWRDDRGGCNGIRAALLPAFRSEIPNLKGKTANTIGDLLGGQILIRLPTEIRNFTSTFSKKDRIAINRALNRKAAQWHCG